MAERLTYFSPEERAIRAAIDRGIHKYWDDAGQQAVAYLPLLQLNLNALLYYPLEILLEFALLQQLSTFLMPKFFYRELQIFYHRVVHGIRVLQQ